MVDTQRLLKRGDTYHYHRRVPLHLVDIIGKKHIRRSLGTDSPKEARRLRTMEDARTELMFRHAEKGSQSGPRHRGRLGGRAETIAKIYRQLPERNPQVP